MKHLKHLLIASTVTALCACNNTKESPVSLQWEMVKNGAAPGFYESSFTITNTSTKPLFFAIERCDRERDRDLCTIVRDKKWRFGSE